MTNEKKECYTEVLTILNQMEPKYQSKIPKKLIEYYKENCSKNYSVNIDLKKTLKNQNLKKETLTMLAILDLNYWCETEKEKQQLINRYLKNEINHQNELREKYNPDNIFKNSLKADNFKGMDSIKQNMALINNNQQKWYEKIFSKLFSFFNKK